MYVRQEQAREIGGQPKDHAREYKNRAWTLVGSGFADGLRSLSQLGSSIDQIHIANTHRR